MDLRAIVTSGIILYAVLTEMVIYNVLHAFFLFFHTELIMYPQTLPGRRRVRVSSGSLVLSRDTPAAWMQVWLDLRASMPL